MSEDHVVASRRPVELTDVIAALGERMPERSIRADAAQRWIVVVEENEDVPLAWIGLSQPVAEPVADADRLGLALQPNDELRWWTEVCGRAPAVVAEVTDALTATLGGATARWSTAVTSGRAAAPPAPGDCPVDLVTDHEALLLCSRPVVALTPWLVEAGTWSAQADRPLVLLTPVGTTLTRPAASWLLGTGGHWAVDGGDGLYDGFTGLRLTSGDRGLHDTPTPHPKADRQASDLATLAVDVEALHDYDTDVTVGRLATALVETIGQATGRPLGLDRFGTVEPLGIPLDLDELGRAAADHAPGPSRFFLAGGDSTVGADAIVTVVPGPVGVLEHVACLATGGQLVDDPAAAADVARRLIDHGASSVILGARRTDRARLVPARSTGDLTPLAVAVRLHRYPGLDIARALALGGPGSEHDEARHALILTQAADDAVTRYAALLALLDEHDLLADTTD